MANLVDQINELGKTTGVTVGGAASANNNYRTTTAPTKPSFASSVGHTLASLPGQAASALVHGVVDPFAHLIGNAGNALNANKNAAAADQASKALDAASTKAKAAFTAGHITRAQYVQQLHGITQQATGLAQAQHANQVKSIPQMLPDAAQAIGTVATLGAGGLEAGAAKAGVEALASKVGAKTVGKVAGKVIQSGEDLIGAGKNAGSTIATQLPGKIVRNAVLTQPTVQYGAQTAHDVASGNVPGVALDAGLALAPGAIGLASKGIKAIAPSVRDALLGKSATLTEAFGVNRVKQFLADNADKPDTVNTLKQMELFTEDQPAVKSGKISAGEFLAQHFADELHLDPKSTPLNEIVAKFENYAKNDSALQTWLEKNPQGKSVVLSHDFTGSIPQVAERLKAVEGADAQTRVKVANQVLDELGIKNPSIRDKVGGQLLSGASAKDIQAALKQHAIIETPKGTLDKGYIATYGPKDVAKIPSKEAAREAGQPIVGSNAHGIAGMIGKTLEKAGMGLKSTPSSVTSAAIKDNLNTRLAGTDFEGQGKEIMSRLHDAKSKTRGVFDPRLLRATTAGLVPGAVNIEHELGVSSGDAKMILKAVKGAYGDVPLGTRSLGEKITDKTIQHFPPMAGFLKAQGYGKYTANPFFWAKQGTKGEFIAQAETGGKTPNLGRMLNTMLGTEPKQDTMSALDKAGYLSKNNAAGGEADFFGNLAPGLGDKVSGPQVSGYNQQSMGQAAEQFAKNNKTTVADILKNGEDGVAHPLKQDFDHLMQMVVGYPKGSNALNTNLAKSLNVLVFPSRFEAKVAMAASHYFMSQPKVIQLAMINGVLKGNAWASSPQGKQWEKDNADFMGIVNYFSPTHSINAVADFLHTGNAGDLGQVGGMPFGVITTILKNQGIKLPTAVTGNDLNPATGEAYVQHLPTSAKARLQQVLADLIGQMFSYPGATVGLPSKAQTIGTYVPGLKINASEQKTVGSASTPPSAPAPTSNASNPTRSIPRANPVVIPKYKSSTSSAPKAKVHAIKPANSAVK